MKPKHTYRSVSPRPHLQHLSLRQQLLRHARLEAHALAHATPYPSLLLPVLLEEKERQAQAYADRQFQLWSRSASHAFAA